MDIKIQLIAKQKQQSSNNQNLNQMSDDKLQSLLTHYMKGCKKIFHKQGYMNSKGDAPYDFTCDSSHRCPKCSTHWRSIFDQKNLREEKRVAQANKIKVQKNLQEYRKKYFIGKPNCKCQQNKICEQCVARIQEIVTKNEKGCGATWIQQFGGMAAGPAYVTCADNYFLCEKCSEQLAYINKLCDQYKIKLNHMAEGQKMFWSPKTYPYYSGLL